MLLKKYNFKDRVFDWMSNSFLGLTLSFIVVIFALIGVLFVSVFVGMRFGVFNVKGSIDNRNEFYTDSKNQALSGSDDNLAKIEKIQKALRSNMASVRKEVFPDISFDWVNSSEWQTLSIALTNDREVIKKAASDAGVSPRVLVSVVIAEQLRFFTSDRENFKKFFEPLKILGTLSQFSLGVSGVKPETAKLIEKNLKDKNSAFYISSEYENLLDYKNINNLASSTSTKNIYSATSSSVLTGNDRELYDRLTDSHNHYYSYLYTALFIKEVESQWKKSGYDISNRPEILATIFNLGFEKSNPKNNPETAGSIIEIGKEKISFGNLAFQFYYSGELLDVFGF